MGEKFKYIYGPVPSWRLGSSLGIDPLSQKDKICSFGCLYCQLGNTNSLTLSRYLYVPEDLIAKEIDLLPEDISVDYFTLSGRGEPTLASNVSNIIKTVKKIRKEAVAIITNSSLINIKDIQDSIASADFIIAKLDACSQKLFNVINKPFTGLDFESIIGGLKEFRQHFKGKFALQVMFVRENAIYAEEIAKIAMEIQPDEVQINTPLRPCGAEPLSTEELAEIKRYFTDLNSITVYESHKKEVKSISNEDTLKRRGKI